jgi:RNA polymerase sigma-70 factor (ECF subfamily)
MEELNEDKILAEEFLSGNEDAFSELVKKYSDNLYNFIFSLTGDRMMAEDIVQETFVKAWKNMKRFDTSKNFKTWLFTIGKNTAMDFLKKKKATPFSFFEKDGNPNPFEEIVDENELADIILTKDETGEELRMGLDKIKDKYRIILKLCYIEDMSLSEISEVLEIPYNTAKSQHARALLSLKKILLQ